ncbi:MAG: termination factor Rho, partial [Alistipes sp.]
MSLLSKYSDVILNLLIAVAISLVVNFSYLLLFIVDQKDVQPHHPHAARSSEVAAEGRLSVTPDGHGYLLYEEAAIDSVYVPMSRIRKLGLADGDRLEVKVMPPRTSGAHSVMSEVVLRNGEKFDYSTLFNRPSEILDMTLQLLYYLVLSFILLTILTAKGHNYPVSQFIRRCVWCLLVAVLLYFVAPVAEWRSGNFVINCMSGHILDYLLLL